jgi:hypothetical protein
MVRRMLMQKSAPQPRSRNTPRGGRKMARLQKMSRALILWYEESYMILQMSLVVKAMMGGT